MRIAYDCTLYRPGCVLLQAGKCADSKLAHRFDARDWLVAPTPNLRVYEVTEEQLGQLVAMTAVHRGAA